MPVRQSQSLATKGATSRCGRGSQTESELIPAGIARVGEAAGDVEMGDRIPVEEDVSATVEPGEGEDGEHERERGDKEPVRRCAPRCSLL